MENNIDQIKKYITSGQCVTVNGMPGVGISLFLKEVCGQNFAEFHYINVFGLSEMTADALLDEVANALGITAQDVNKLASIQKALKHNTFSKSVVFAFAGFDKLEKNVNKDLFDTLRAIRSIDRTNILFLFGICKRLETIIPEQVMDSEISMFSTKLYLKPYSKEDTKELLKKYGPFIPGSDEKIELSGGHFQLLQLLLQTEYPNSPLSDQFIVLCLKNILSHLTTTQKRELIKIAQNKSVIIDPYLSNIGIVSDKHEIFSPLLLEFLLKNSTTKIPSKEGILFRLLKSRSGKVVEKNEIFRIVWKDNSENATDWALDSLVYRLRKNDIFKKSGFEIESIKKIGYKLVKI